MRGFHRKLLPLLLIVAVPTSILVGYHTQALLSSSHESARREVHTTSYLRELGAADAALHILSKETDFVDSIKSGGEFPLRHFSREAFRASLVRIESMLDLDGSTAQDERSVAVRRFLERSNQVIALGSGADDAALTNALQELRGSLADLIKRQDDLVADSVAALPLKRGDLLRGLAIISLVFITLAALVVYLVAERLNKGFAKTLQASAVHRQYFQDILNSMKEGILVTDLVGHVTYANSRARELLAASSSQIVGEHVAVLLSGRWEIDGNGGPSRCEATLKTAEGSVREVVIERSNLLDQQHGIQGMLFLVDDITEKVALARSVADFKDKLTRGEKVSALGTMGAIIAHKLSQPISSVRLFLQQVKREVSGLPLSERAKSNLDDSLVELDRIAQLTKQMLKTEKGHFESGSSVKSIASVSTALLKVRDSLSDEARRRGVTLSVRTGKREVYVRCAEVELEEMLFCLISNSMQAAPLGAKSRVEVGVESTEKDAFITVSDNCRGIPADHIDKIFDCFFTTKPEGQGTGLGLAIVRHIAERHGGCVKVSSQEGYGACFMISLPVVEEVLDAQTAESVCC